MALMKIEILNNACQNVHNYKTGDLYEVNKGSSLLKLTKKYS